MFVEGANGVRPIGDGLLEVSDASLSKLIASGDINEIYDVEHTPFARGKFATVRRAMHKQTGVSFAAKFLRRRRRAQCTLKEIRHEIAILLLCADSEHIVKLHSVHETMVETALVLEMANGGELQTLLDEAGSLSEHQTIICMQEVLKALQFLHKKCIAHLDLKPQNILLCGKRVEDGLKLCDFGISRIVEETGSKVREILGTPDYVAPEVLSYEPLSLKTDIWSVGVLAYVLLSGFSPFGGDTKQETFLNISQCNLNFPDGLFEDVSEDAKDFIKSALQVAAEDRMSAVECLEHKWLSESSELLSIVKDSTTKTNVISPNDIIPENHHVVIEAKKLQEIDSVGTSPTPLPPPSSPPKASAGFFLHQTPKNGTALDEVLFSSLNNGFNATANNANASKTLNGIDHHHHNYHQHHHHNQQQQQHHAHHHNNHSMECAKTQNTTLNNNNNHNNNNNSCNNINNPNDKSDLLKDYATNKENINLSKILANRIAPQSTASTVNNLQLISNLTTTLHNNNSSNNGALTMTTYADSSSSTATATAAVTTTNNISTVLATVQSTGTAAASSTTIATPPSAQTKHETVLFPDAPTTPKVLRKSNQSDADHHTPSCVALVKQFQLNNGTLSNNQRIDFDEISVSSDNVGLVTTNTPYTTTQSTPPNRSKFAANLTTEQNNREILPSYRLSATAITTTTTNTTNGHHSLGSSTLSINTLTESSVGVVTQQHSNSTITMNCLCGADKTAVNCCCNSSSRTALNYRKKSLAVVDSSILC